MDFKPSTSSHHQQKVNSHHPHELLNNIPLIKAPGTWLPKPVSFKSIIVLPADLHPMPDDITAYFVYPYTLESSSLNYLSNLKSHPKNLEIQSESAQSYLSQRDQLKSIEKEKVEKQIELKKIDLLKKLAPGWNGQMDSIVSSTSSNSNHQSNDLI
ncbi:hypothetical protein DFH28DRAFT_1095917 [Melampsora americana]|nr:hypothetical protein DFH28DRAFT_1095917 [Melampsora americana]